jgi:hypothetical protein
MTALQPTRRLLVPVLLACLGALPLAAGAQTAEWEAFEPRPREYTRLSKPPQTAAIEFSGRRVDPSSPWSGLGEEDREAVRKTQVPALGAGDEPPYPRLGLKALVERLYRVRGPLGQPLRVHLMIGNLGQVEYLAVDAPVSKQFMGDLLTLLQNSGFKPGLCGEKVCARPFTLDIVYLGGH